MSKIHPKTRIGAVSLSVSNLDRSLDYYQKHLGFKVHHKHDQSATMGAGDRDLLLLHEKQNPERVGDSTGLYHFAILVPNRISLSRVLRQLVETGAPFQGFSDHGVSEAIYLADPDGNGIEVYRDRPRDHWPLDEDKLNMTTSPLNVEELLAQSDQSNSMGQYLPKNTVIGHIHLKVAELRPAVSFYRDVLGFDLMQRYGPGAAFLSAGGYHHHVGVNTWTSAGASFPPLNAPGLQWYTINIPDNDNLQDVLTRIRDANITVEKREKGYYLHDPSKNGIILTRD